MVNRGANEANRAIGGSREKNRAIRAQEESYREEYMPKCQRAEYIYIYI